MAAKQALLRRYLSPGAHGLLLFIFLLFPIALSQATPVSAETMVLSLTVNLESKGDFFVHSSGDGDFLLKAEDLKAMGFRSLTGKGTEMGGEPYVSLRSLTGVSFRYNPQSLTLEITAPPSLLGRKIIDFASQRQQDIFYPRESSAFFNYRGNFAAGSSGFKGFDLLNQLGMRRGDLLFLTDSVYSKTPSETKLVRLTSNLTLDRRDELRRTVIGDFFTAPSGLGSNVMLGGIRYAKAYSVDPYFINYPSINLSGAVSTPSEVDIYLDGMKLRSEKLPPGEFELKNLYLAFGAGLAELVIKDPFGREERIILPYYLSDRLLKKGLHEYSYNLGFIRKEFAVQSNKYSRPAFSLSHNYGRDDTLTLGVSSEGSSTFINIAPQANYLLGTAGIFSASVGASAGGEGENGFAGLLAYGYNTRHVSARLQLKGYSKGYATLESKTSEDRVRYEVNAGAGYGRPVLGSLSFELMLLKKHSGQSQDQFSLNYTRRLSRSLDLFSNLRLIRGGESDSRIFVGVTYYLGKEHQVSTWVDAGKSSNKEIVQLQKNTPLGEGYGYRASLERSATPGGSVYAINPAGQYNGRHGIYTADIRAETGGGSTAATYQLGAAGAIAYVGKTVALTRPISDSFAVVKVGDLEGVRVYQNSQEIGRTDVSGKVFIDNLNSFLDNQISINDKDIPLDYSLASVLRHVSPPLRSGSCIVFQAAKQQPVTGTLIVTVDGKAIPLEYLEVRIAVDGGEIVIPTGKGGEFYFDPGQTPPHPAGTRLQDSGCAALETASAAAVKAGQYRATIEYEGRTYSFIIQIPQSDGIFIDLGRVIINANTTPARQPEGVKP